MACLVAVLARPALPAADRVISFYNTHTSERLTVTYKVDGRYVPAAMAQINHILRDWRQNLTIEMDPRLIDLVWEVYQRTGATQPINIICGYRAPETNAMLRANSTGVAENSQHMYGNALDFFIPGVDLTTLRNTGLQMQIGGVGFYPTSGSPFVHMDVGSVRMWPRVTRTQLAQVFPDGRSLYVPSDGNPLPGYAEAQAAYNARGQEVVALYGPAIDGGTTRFARLNNRDNDTPAAATVPATTVAPAPVQVAAAMDPTYVPTPPLRRPDREPIPGVVVTPAPAPTTAAPIPTPVPRPEPAVTEPTIVLAYAPAADNDHDPLALLTAPGATITPIAPERTIPTAAPFPAARIWYNPLTRLVAPDTDGTDLPLYDNTVTGRQAQFAVVTAPNTTNSPAFFSKPEQVLGGGFEDRGFVRAASFSGPLVREVALTDVSRPTTLASAR